MTPRPLDNVYLFERFLGMVRGENLEPMMRRVYRKATNIGALVPRVAGDLKYELPL